MENKAKRLYKNLSIRSKMLLVLYVQIIIPLILIGFISYKISSNIIQNKFTAYSQDILRMIELRMDDYVSNISTLSDYLLYDETIYAVLKDAATKNMSAIDRYEKENEINNVLKKFVLSRREEIQAVCMVTNKGDYYPYDNNTEKTGIRYDMNYNDILQKARKGSGKIVWYVDMKNGKVNNVYLTRTIYDRDTFREIGLQVIMIKKEFLETVYQSLNSSDVQNVAIVTGNGNTIVSKNPGEKDLLTSILPKTMANKKGYYTDGKTNLLVSYISMKQPDWHIVTYISLGTLYKEVSVLGRWVVILCIASVLLLSVLSIYTAFDITTPISRIVKSMKKLEKGESVTEVKDDRKDEIGYLNKSFNEMAKEIDYLMNEIYLEQLTRKEAELKALQAQINPHFLFNTLESINWMAQLNNVPEISETVSSLASLMEASIGRDDKLITVKEEFDYIDNYISIMKRRYEDRIEFHKSLQEDVKNINIPKLLIQPLIENAVYHGIDRIREKGVIQLTAYGLYNDLKIEVIDNGLGIENEELKHINENLSQTNDVYFKNLGKKRSKSIGIENVNRRIKLFFGDKYGLRIESEAGKYTKVIVTIPREY